LSCLTTHSQYTTTNIITTIYTILLPFLVLSDTHTQRQYTNTNIITTFYTVLSLDLVLPDTHNQYTDTNILPQPTPFSSFYKISLYISKFLFGKSSLLCPCKSHEFILLIQSEYKDIVSVTFLAIIYNLHSCTSYHTYFQCYIFQVLHIQKYIHTPFLFNIYHY